ncbi:MAG: hypothetical protein AAFN74_01800 [Myxococcota bacterium]
MHNPAPSSSPPPSSRLALGVLLRRLFAEIVLPNRVFIALLAAGFLLSGAVYQDAFVARWLGFLFAAYAAVANDSIQTIGTFIASNRKTKWYWLWLFIGGIFVATVAYSWATFGGDVSYERLSSKGFSQAPESFAYLQVVAPLILVILTRMRMPVSTTFLLLTSFATNVSSIGGVLFKSLTGYVLAFVVAAVVWGLLAHRMDKWFTGEAHPAWRIGQWITSGLLWSVWIQQDAANIAVYLPRALSTLEFIIFASVVFLGLGILFKSGGEKIQQVVDEKSSVIDVRPATIIDLVYAVILYYFKIQSKIPMSTTWVFLGLLGGRELMLSLKSLGRRDMASTLRIIGRDVGFAFIGLAVSVALAAMVNEKFAAELLSAVGMG